LCLKGEKERKTMNRRAVLGTLIGATLGSAILVPLRSPSGSTTEKPVKYTAPDDRRRSRFPNVPLQTHEHQEVRFYDDLIKDKTVLINFMYTECQGGCPLTTANLVQVQQALGERVGRDIFMYSISVDSEHDTPEELRKYAKRFAVQPGWLFLTGAKANIARIRASFGDTPSLEASQSNHLSVIRLGIEPLERWAGCPTWSTPKTIIRYLSWIEPNGQRPDGSNLRIMRD
jgi:protein SCO1